MSHFAVLCIYVVIGSGIWTYFDARKNVRDGATYKDLGSSPIFTAISVIMLWIVVFPWYMYKRHKWKEKFVSIYEPLPIEPSESSYCQNCGNPRLNVAQFCSACGRPFDPVTGETDLPATTSKTTASAVLCFSAAALVGISSFMPYILIPSTLGLNLSRSPFQFGSGGTLSYQGPLILLGAAFFVFGGLRVLGAIAPNKPVGRFQPLGGCVASLIFIIMAWQTSGWGNPGSSVSVVVDRGYGGVVGLAGVAVGLLAVFVRSSSSTTQRTPVSTGR